MSVLLCRAEGSNYIPQKLFGEVTSPLYPKPYPSNFQTTSVITVPSGYRVKLVFRQFDLEPSEDCFYDYVKVGGTWKRGISRAPVLPSMDSASPGGADGWGVGVL